MLNYFNFSSDVNKEQAEKAAKYIGSQIFASYDNEDKNFFITLPEIEIVELPNPYFKQGGKNKVSIRISLKFHNGLVKEQMID